jgi:hypothetical protein
LSIKWKTKHSKNKTIKQTKSRKNHKPKIIPNKSALKNNPKMNLKLKLKRNSQPQLSDKNPMSHGMMLLVSNRPKQPFKKPLFSPSNTQKSLSVKELRGEASCFTVLQVQEKLFSQKHVPLK